MSKKIKVTLVKSVIGRPEQQRKVAKTLGLKKTNSYVIHEDTPAIRGMVNAISHLVDVEEVDA
ncbi:MAG: 50S ribosomal protein L30 [Bacillota bacterium]